VKLAEWPAIERSIARSKRKKEKELRLRRNKPEKEAQK